MLSGNRTADISGFIKYDDITGNKRIGWEGILQKIKDEISAKYSNCVIDIIAMRGVFSGSEFEGPTPVNPEVIEKLKKILHRAPIHLPLLVQLIENTEKFFKGVPIILVFDTSFFAKLSVREHKYALDNELMNSCGFRRYGYKGIFHESASYYAHNILNKKTSNSLPKVLSICLEPHPEIAAVIGNRPVMVTSGATPLESLPSERSCGDIDPSIVLTVIRETGWGLEKINKLLTQESGLYGLLGKYVKLEELFKSNDPEYRKAIAIIQHHILLACGSGIAAMGGVDAIIFSGRYYNVGKVLSPWLLMRLNFVNHLKDKEVEVLFLRDTLDTIIADKALTVVLEKMFYKKAEV